MLSIDPRNPEDGSTEFTTASAFILALQGASRSFPRVDNLQRITGFSYSQLMKNYVRLVSQKDLPLEARLIQFELYMIWQACDSSEHLHTLMCKELSNTVHLLRETSSDPKRHQGPRDMATKMWSLMLGRPSSHQMQDVAEAIAAGLILYMGEWIMTVTEDQISASRCIQIM